MQIGLSSWSLHREFDSGMDVFGFLEVVSKRYRLQSVEIVSTHLASTRAPYLKEVKASLKAQGLNVANVPIDGDTAINVALDRKRHLGFFLDLFDAAVALGAASVRANAGEAESSDLQKVIQGYSILAEECGKRGLHLLIENHGGPTGDPENILAIIRAVGSPSLGTCPDTGNFEAEVRYRGLELLTPHMRLAHVKTYDFDHEGNETTIDVPRCLGIFKRAGFDGLLSVEYEGKPDAYLGVEKSIALLRRSLP